MADAKRMTVAEYASKLREEYDIPDGITDGQLVSRYVGKHPEALKEIKGSEPRRTMEPEGSMPHRFLMGMGESATPGVPDLAGAWSPGAGRSLQHGNKVMDRATAPIDGSSIDLPNIKKDFKNRNYAGGAGRITAQGLMIGLGIDGMTRGMGAGMSGAEELKGAEVIGEGYKTDPAMMDVAKAASKPQSMALDKAIAKIDEALEHQYVDANKLSAGIAYAKKVMTKLHKVSGAQVKDFSAAQEAVARLAEKVKGQKTLGWQDARTALNELKAAKQGLGSNPSAAKTALTEVIDSLDSGMKETATSAGHGQAYEKWISDYRSLSRWQRAYAKTLKGHTQPQVEAGLKAKGPTTLGIRGVGSVQFGGNARKVAKSNKQMLNKMHTALDALDKQIKTKVPQAQPAPPQITGQSTLMKADKPTGPISGKSTLMNTTPEPPF